MHYIIKIITFLLIFSILCELICSGFRLFRRSDTYKRAEKESKKVNKPLLVVGDPDAGLTNSMFGRVYGCGDLCVDLNGCGCDKSERSDLYEFLKKQKDNSYVIYESCVLEYIPKEKRANIIEEMKRVGISNYTVRISPSLYCGMLTGDDYISKITTLGVKEI